MNNANKKGFPAHVPNSAGGKKAYEQKKKEKERKRLERSNEDRRAGQVRRIVKYIIWLGILSLIGYGIYFGIASRLPKGEDMSRAIPVMESNAHIPLDAPLPEYNSNPPTSGPHYETPARPGFREENIADGNLIHSLEHGLVLISYHPRIEDESEKLRDIVGPLTVVVPRSANEADIALAAWGRLETFDIEEGTIGDSELQRIRDFIIRYANKGPEHIPAGRHGGI